MTDSRWLNKAKEKADDSACTTEHELNRLKYENTVLRSRLSEIEGFLNLAPAFFSRLDLAGRILGVNQLVTQALNMPESSVVGQFIWNLESFRDYSTSRAILQDAFMQALEGRTTPIEIELSMYISGVPTPRWGNGVVHPIYNKDGKLAYVSIVGTDVTDLKEAQFRLQESELRTKRALQETQDLLNIAPAFFGFVDPKSFQVTRTNDLSLQVIGCAREDVIGQIMWEAPWWKPIPESSALIEDAVKKGAQGISSSFDVEFWAAGPTAEGQRRWSAFSVVPLFDGSGKIDRLAATGIDITDRKVAEVNLKESESRLQLALVSGNIGFWDWNLVTGQVEISETLMKDWGIEPGQYHHTRNESFKYIHPDDQPLVQKAIERAILHLEPYDVEYRVKRSDGEIIWINAKGRCLLDKMGKPVRLTGITNNITDRYLSRNQLRQAKDEAERANQVKSAFLANMSHEIRTPLAAILGFTDLLKERNLSIDERQQFLGTISRNGHALTRIIDDILDLSKVEAGRLELEAVEFAPLEIVEDIVDLFRERARAKGLYVILNIGPNLPRRVFADPVRLRQILVNILGNAIKFTAVGGVTISISAAAARDGFCFQIDVGDTGIGLTEEQKGKLFEPFSQADSSVSRKFGGTGLGLVLSRKLAQALGGDIVISKTSEKGSVFTITFQAQRAQSEGTVRKEEKITNSEAISNPALRVLLAEDSVDNQYLIETVLKRAGIYVEVATNGADALKFALSNEYDLVLMDIQMPVMDGLEATRSLRKAGYRKPIIALTAHAMVEERERTRAAGCNDHLTKPLNVKELIKTVNDYTH